MWVPSRGGHHPGGRFGRVCVLGTRVGSLEAAGRLIKFTSSEPRQQLSLCRFFFFLCKSMEMQDNGFPCTLNLLSANSIKVLLAT